jgi:hypothetical protein
MQEGYEQTREPVAQKAATPPFKGHTQPRSLLVVENDRPARSDGPEPSMIDSDPPTSWSRLKQRFPLPPRNLDKVLRYFNTHTRTSARFH